MKTPSKFPTSIWDGLTKTRDLYEYNTPSPEDWDQIVAEIISMETLENTIIQLSDNIINLKLSNWYHINLENDLSFQLENTSVGRKFVVSINANGFDVTWWEGIKWSGGISPVLSVNIDIFIFKCIDVNTYLGFTAGRNHF